jgi:hypothetical protein
VPPTAEFLWTEEGQESGLVSGRPMWVGDGFEPKTPDTDLSSSRTVRPDSVRWGHGQAWAGGLCFAYDPLGRTAWEQWLAGESLVSTLQYTYDVGSRVTVAQDRTSCALRLCGGRIVTRRIESCWAVDTSLVDTFVKPHTEAS